MYFDQTKIQLFSASLEHNSHVGIDRQMSHLFCCFFFGNIFFEVDHLGFLSQRGTLEAACLCGKKKDPLGRQTPETDSEQFVALEFSQCGRSLFLYVDQQAPPALSCIFVFVISLGAAWVGAPIILDFAHAQKIQCTQFYCTCVPADRSCLTKNFVQICTTTGMHRLVKSHRRHFLFLSKNGSVVLQAWWKGKIQVSTPPNRFSSQGHELLPPSYAIPCDPNAIPCSMRWFQMILQLWSLNVIPDPSKCHAQMWCPSGFSKCDPTCDAQLWSLVILSRL